MKYIFPPDLKTVEGIFVCECVYFAWDVTALVCTEYRSN